MKKSSFNYDELIDCANGKLFGPGNAKLPLPPMLMFDRITEITESQGFYKKGSAKPTTPDKSKSLTAELSPPPCGCPQVTTGPYSFNAEIHSH